MSGYSHKVIFINNREVMLPEILSGEDKTSSPFESATVEFIRDWMKGAKTFSLQTSGSTGAPKKIELSREQFQKSAQRTITALSLNVNDTAFISLDTKYIAGKMMLVRALEHNLKIIATEPSSNPLRSLTHSTKNTFAAFVPLQIDEMLKHADSIKQLNNMRSIIIGGGTIHGSLLQKIKNLVCPVFATYGMTETVSHIALQRLNGPEATDYFSVLSGIQIATDERQCLVIQIPEFPEKIITNDLVRIISPNRFQWLGRYDNVINSGGYKISPEKIEEILEKIIPQQFFVTGIPDDKLGEKLVLIIEGAPHKIDLQSVLHHPYELPKEVIYLAQFIRTETGKVNRLKTKALIANGQ